MIAAALSSPITLDNSITAAPSRPSRQAPFVIVLSSVIEAGNGKPCSPAPFIGPVIVLSATPSYVRKKREKAAGQTIVPQAAPITACEAFKTMVTISEVQSDPLITCVSRVLPGPKRIRVAKALARARFAALEKAKSLNISPLKRHLLLKGAADA
jgi:hypothetical protein